MPAKRPTQANGSGLAAVAECAGVSLATASRVLAGSTHRVSGDLRDRVLRAAEELDYIPNATARSLIVGTRKIVGVLQHDMLDFFTAANIRALEEVADRAGWLIMLVNAGGNVEKELRYLRMFRAERVGAIILVGSGLDDDGYRAMLTRELDGFVKAGGRVATAGRHDLPHVEFVPDNVGGAQAAIEYLLSQGHRRIGIISSPPKIIGTRERIAGAKRAFARAGIPWSDDLVVDGDHRRASGASACETLLARAPDVTAIFAMSDEMALGVYDVAHKRGLSIPEDLSVVGYDDTTLSRDVAPALTTVIYPNSELARRAMEACLADAPPEATQLLIPCDLIVRKSVARV
ncbi:MAG: LacI family DNA-binding transcriptional regulator [Candidatus Aquilonibacter sp.]